MPLRDVPEAVRESAVLTPYAVLSRYPARAEPISDEEYDEAVRIAGTVVEWFEARLSARTGPAP